jgi:hypothetical protein
MATRKDSLEPLRLAFVREAHDAAIIAVEAGVHIEDLVVAPANSHERLNDSPRDWEPL